MSMNEVASGQRVHISFFGRRNAGKSSLVNAVTGQSLSVVSEYKGTTTDLVKKAMEILPLGPVVIVDTPGLDDVGELGDLRVKKSRQAIDISDIAVLVVDVTTGIGDCEKSIIEMCVERKLPYVVVLNKIDLLGGDTETKAIEEIEEALARVHAKASVCKTSTVSGDGIDNLKNVIANLAPKNNQDKMIVADLLDEGNLVVMVTPIDSSAPKGRIILPQQNVLRELLDIHCKTLVCQETELAELLSELKRKPSLVITDSQVFGKVDKIVPSDIPLTSFSILFARYKGLLDTLVEGADTLMQLKDGDKVLIAEGCTHHRQCEDIGTVKLPGWIRKVLEVEPEFEWASGNDFADDLTKYRLIIHCGGCVMTETAMKSRISKAESAGVPIVNYGVAIAKLHNMLDRSLEPFR